MFYFRTNEDPTLPEDNAPKYGIVSFTLVMALLILILLPVLLWPYFEVNK